MKQFFKDIWTKNKTMVLIFSIVILVIPVVIYLSFNNFSSSSGNEIVTDPAEYAKAKQLLKEADSLSKEYQNVAALTYYKQALGLLSGDSLNIKRRKIHQLMADLYNREMKYNDALKNLYAAMDLTDKKDGFVIADINMVLAGTYVNQGLIKEGLSKYSDAEKFYEKDPVRYKSALNKVYMNKAVCNNYLYKDDEAFKYHKKALEFADKKDTAMYSTTLKNIGAAYLSQNKIDSGMIYLNAAKTIDSIRKDYLSLTAYYANTAEIDFNNKKTELAIEKTKIALSYDPKIKFPMNVMSMYGNMAIYYKALNDYKTASEYQDKYLTLMDSLNSTDRIKQIAAIENNYKIQQKDNEIKQIELTRLVLQKDLENKQKQKYLLLTGLLLMVAIVLYGYKFYNTRIIKSELKEHLLESEKIILQKDNLLLENEKQLIENDKALLNSELDKTKKELEYNSSLIDEKETLIHDLEEKLLASMPKEFDQRELLAIIDSVKEGLKQEKENLGVDIMLNESNVLFFKKLKEKHPDISKTEARLCTLLYLNLETKELARIMNISIEGVRKGKHRLRKKMELDAASNITDYLQAI